MYMYMYMYLYTYMYMYVYMYMYIYMYMYMCMCMIYVYVLLERTVVSGEFQAFGVDIQWRNSHSQQFVLNVAYPIARLFTKACVWDINALVCHTSTKINHPD